MLSEEMSDRLAAVVRTCQLIVAAFVTGCIVFLAVAGWKYTQGQAADGAVLDTTSLVLLGCAFGPIVARFFVPNLAATAARRKLAENRSLTGDALATALMGVFQTRAITAAALLEGAAFMAIMVFFLSGSPVGLAAGAAVVFLLSTCAPTYDRAEAWLEEELRAVEQDRSLGAR